MFYVSLRSVSMETCMEYQREWYEGFGGDQNTCILFAFEILTEPPEFRDMSPNGF